MLAPNTNKPKSYDLQLEDAVDDLIERGRPYTTYDAPSDHGAGGYEIVWPHGEPKIGSAEFDSLIAARINEVDEWASCINDSDNYDMMRFFLTKAFTGQIGAPQLGNVIIKEARKHFGKQVQEHIDLFIEKTVLQERE